MKQEAQKFKGKYRIASARWQKWDYTSDGSYFVTICTQHRWEWFGRIKDEQIKLSPTGKIIEKYWTQIPNHFEHAILDEWVVMPNHVHGIIIICSGPMYGVVETGRNPHAPRRDEACLVSTNATATSAKKPKPNISPKPGSLSVIVGSFKSACTRYIRKHIDPDFTWQTRFHDRVIRNEPELNRIRQYIIDNPANWEQDRNNQNHQFKTA